MRERLVGLRSLGVEMVLVLGTALVAAALLFCKAEGLTPHLSPLALRGARWMTTPDQAPVAYFRKELYVDRRVKDAWVTIAAGEANFKLRVNGEIVGESWVLDRNAAGIYDLTPYLKPGKNALALNVRSANYSLPARAVVAGGYRDVAGSETLFSSDSSWSAASRFEAQGNLEIPWYDSRYIQQHETPALGGEAPDPKQLPHLPVDAALFSVATPPWITTPDPSSTSAVFSGVFDVAVGFRTIWLRVACPDGYALALNGVRIFGRVDPAPILEIHDITPFVNRGRNTLDVRVSSPSSLPRIALDLIIDRSGTGGDAVSWTPTWTVSASGSAQQPAAALPPVEAGAAYGGPAGFAQPLPKKLRVDALPSPWLARAAAGALFFGFGILCLALADWVIMGLILRSVASEVRWTTALRYDALLRLPVLLLFAALWVIGTDERNDPGFAFRPNFTLAAVGVLFALRLLLVAWLALAHRRRAVFAPSIAFVRGAWLRHGLALLCLAPLLVTGAFLRTEKARAASFGHDELSMVRFAQAIDEFGSPIRYVGPLKKRLTTYELLPYPIWLSMKAFGQSEFAARLPAIVFGMLTTLLLYVIGTTTWRPGVGLMAAAVHALSPFSIFWGANAFHPQQAQFFALLTTWLFYLAFGTGPGPVRRLPLAAAAVSFCFMYLSWEGAGVLLPALVLCLLVQRGRHLSWLREPFVWLAACAVSVVVIGQLARRTLDSRAFLAVGSSIAGNALSLGFLSTTYNPWAYVQTFLLAPHHLILTLLLILGLPVAIRNRAVQYYVILLVAVLMTLTNFVVPQSPRYAYFAQPLLLLPACASLFLCADYLRSRAPSVLPGFLRVTVACCVAFAATGVLASSNSLVLRTERLGARAGRMLPDVTPEVGGLDYRSAAEFVAQNRRKGDTVIALMPQALLYYANFAPDYYLQSYTSRLVMYDMNDANPRYMDRFAGSTVLRSEKELAEVLNQHRRAWIMATPAAAFDGSNDAVTLDFVNRSAKVVFETYGMRIYLWER